MGAAKPTGGDGPAVPGDDRQDARYGVVSLERTRKDDGRQLIYYRRVDGPAQRERERDA